MSSVALSVQRNPHPHSEAERAAALAAPGFGQYFTDHMVRIDWTADRGWDSGAVLPYGPLALDPATSALHYGQLIFEGLKAYRQPDGSIATFRPEANAARLARSAHRLAMPNCPPSCSWSPSRAGGHRPALGGLRPGVLALPAADDDRHRGRAGRPAVQRYSYLLIASPVGPYFPSGVKPVTVWLSTEYTRAAPGGTGDAKCAGNYAASHDRPGPGRSSRAATRWSGSTRVEHRYVEEMGAMNLCFVYGSGPDARLVTPKLTGTLLPGITRDRCSRWPRISATAPRRRLITAEDWQAGNAGGELTEVFACGTGAVITPVGHGQERRRRVDRRRRQPRAGHHAAARRRCWTCRPARRPTRTAGCTGSPEVDFAGYLDELQRPGPAAAALGAPAGADGRRAVLPGLDGGPAARPCHQGAPVGRRRILRGGQPDDFRFDPPADGELFEAYDAGLQTLLDAAAGDRRTGPRCGPCCRPPSARLFWARRLAHETAIHRVDAQLAAGFGVAESSSRSSPSTASRSCSPTSAARFDRSRLPGERTISLTPLDSNASWTLLVGPQLLGCRPVAADDADLSVFGLASDLYCWVWNRAGSRGRRRCAATWRWPTCGGMISGSWPSAGRPRLSRTSRAADRPRSASG